MTRLKYWLFALTFAAGCGGSLAGPTPIQQGLQPAAEVARISGRVYASVGPLYAPITSAVIEVNEADGSSVAVTSDADGFYQITARRGSVTITASCEGYEAKHWQFDLLNDTVLNFSLNPR
jgi:hypothetical protein